MLRHPRFPVRAIPTITDAAPVSARDFIALVFDVLDKDRSARSVSLELLVIGWDRIASKPLRTRKLNAVRNSYDGCPPKEACADGKEIVETDG